MICHSINLRASAAPSSPRSELSAMTNHHPGQPEDTGVTTHNVSFHISLDQNVTSVVSGSQERLRPQDVDAILQLPDGPQGDPAATAATGVDLIKSRDTGVPAPTLHLEVRRMPANRQPPRVSEN
jgi:hypothetical protein